MTLPPKGQFAKVGAFDVHYLTFGSGEPVVFLHGSGPGASGYSNFKHNINNIVNSGRQAIIIDMIGFGYSSKPTDIDYTPELFCEVIVTAIQKMGIDTFDLVGNSLGGAVAIQAAVSHPDKVKSLILMAPGGIEEPDVYQSMPGIAKMTKLYMGEEVGRDALGRILKMLVYQESVVDDALIDERFAIFETQPPEVLSRLVFHNMENELKNIQCPILGFWGQKDEFTPVGGAKKILDRCANSSFTILSDCGHWVMVEYADLFNHHVTYFLDNKPRIA